MKSDGYEKIYMNGLSLFCKFTNIRQNKMKRQNDSNVINILILIKMKLKNDSIKPIILYIFNKHDSLSQLQPAVERAKAPTTCAIEYF